MQNSGINEDTRILMGLGFTNGRIIYPGFRHDQKFFTEKPYYGLGGMDLTDDWRGVKEGYIDPDNYHLYTDRPTILNLPQSCLLGSDMADATPKQLKLGTFTSDEAEDIVSYCKENSRFIHAWTHPHNMMDENGKIVPSKRDSAVFLAELLKSQGYKFVTSSQALEMYKKQNSKRIGVC